MNSVIGSPLTAIPVRKPWYDLSVVDKKCYLRHLSSVGWLAGLGHQRAVVAQPTARQQRIVHRPDDSLEFVMRGRRGPAINGSFSQHKIRSVMCQDPDQLIMTHHPYILLLITDDLRTGYTL
jgi:hypothetical protein